jgi:DNA modification methylase
MDLVIENFSEEVLKDWEFSLDDIDLSDELPASTTIPNNVAERFIIPPFSILDAKQGRWQDRKRAWLSLGIKSEEGRDKEITFSRSAQNPAIYEVRNRMREKLGYDPSWDEITEYCKKHDIPMLDGTSVFDPVLCELAYRWFNVPEGVILDPFAGGSVRGIVAAKLGMRYRGVDLRPEQIKANYENAAEMQPPFTENDCPVWKCGDSREIDQHYAGLKADMIFSCPPYADLEVYSDDPRDLSNMEYEEFLNAYKTIIQKSCSLLKENRFAVFVIGEVRGKNGAYYNFVGDTINAFLEAGLHYYNEMILATQIGSLAMRVTNQFNHSRKIGKTHQNVLVFFKGDLKQIPSLYPELDFKEEDFLEKGEGE